MDRLEPCPACRRHVRVSEQSCPFCGQDVRALGELVPRALPTQRLGRAALFAFGVGATAAGSVGCVEEPEDPDADASSDPASTPDAGSPAADAGGVRDRDGGSVVALYGLALPDGGFGGGQPGGAFIPDASAAKDSGPGGDLGGAVALYGLAPPPDAGRSTDAGRAQDAGKAPDGSAGGDLGGVIALYGVAPVPARDGGRGGDLGGAVPLYGLAPPAADES
jgi:hypothetical protein